MPTRRAKQGTNYTLAEARLYETASVVLTLTILSSFSSYAKNISHDPICVEHGALIAAMVSPEGSS